MTDAELLELYAIYADAFTANVAIVATLLFAYLVASYVAASKLGRFQFYGTATVFAVFTLSAAMGAHDLSQRAVSIQSEIERRIALEDSAIAFVAVDGMPEFLPPFILAVCVVAILLSVIFAISQRAEDA